MDVRMVDGKVRVIFRDGDTLKVWDDRGDHMEIQFRDRDSGDLVIVNLRNEDADRLAEGIAKAKAQQ